MRTWASAESLELTEWSARWYLQLTAETQLWSTEYIILLVFFSPSILWALLIYTPTFVATRLLQLHYRIGLGKSDNQNEILVHCIGGLCLNICVGLLLFYAAQTRELKSFFEGRNVAVQEKQVTRVLNSYSDSIVVVEKT